MPVIDRSIWIGQERMQMYASLATLWWHYEDEQVLDWLEDYRPVSRLGIVCTSGLERVACTYRRRGGEACREQCVVS